MDSFLSQVLFNNYMVDKLTIIYYYTKRIDVMRILNIYWLQLMNYDHYYTYIL